MNDAFTAAMRQAGDAVRAGNPAEATRLIQAQLNAAPLPGGQRPLPSLPRIAMADLPRRGPRPARARPANRQTHATPQGSRDYLLHLPAGQTPRALVMMLHGCTQTPEDFAAGTAMNACADQHGVAVLWPAQDRGANMQSCWNWFSPADQSRGRGEPELLADLARTTAARLDIPKDRTFVAGLSAGGAMAAILGQTHPEVFAAVGVHSGLPRGAAHDIPGAFAAMQSGAAPTATPTVPVRSIVFHGTADATVAPANGDQVARAASGNGPTIETTDTGTTSGRTWTRTVQGDAEGAVLVEHWRIDGLGHAWSGGQSAGSFTDPNGPDASAQMLRFFLNLPEVQQ